MAGTVDSKSPASNSLLEGLCKFLLGDENAKASDEDLLNEAARDVWDDKFDSSDALTVFMSKIECGKQRVILAPGVAGQV
ncbi:MAG: hypothetical protein M1816_002993 [Peltula sp. TS41687]|nr:MAG: hypothetical protein M1816_002993 [Peltula sp. TS41687]